MVCALAVALTVAVVSASKAEAEPVKASYYGAGFAGQPTASGEPFDPNALTAAHPTLPFGTQLKVCYQGCTTVTVNDRGPYAGDRGLDLSRAAADAIGLTPVGVATVDVEVLGQGGGESQSSESAAAPGSSAPAASQDETPAASSGADATGQEQSSTQNAASSTGEIAVGNSNSSSVENNQANTAVGGGGAAASISDDDEATVSQTNGTAVGIQQGVEQRASQQAATASSLGNNAGAAQFGNNFPFGEDYPFGGSFPFS